MAIIRSYKINCILYQLLTFAISLLTIIIIFVSIYHTKFATRLHVINIPYKKLHNEYVPFFKSFISKPKNETVVFEKSKPKMKMWFCTAIIIIDKLLTASENIEAAWING